MNTNVIIAAVRIKPRPNDPLIGGLCALMADCGWNIRREESMLAAGDAVRRRFRSCRDQRLYNFAPSDAARPILQHRYYLVVDLLAI